MTSQLGQSTPEKCLLYPGVPEEFVTSNSSGLFCSVRESIYSKILCGLYDQQRPGDFGQTRVCMTLQVWFVIFKMIALEEKVAG